MSPLRCQDSRSGYRRRTPQKTQSARREIVEGNRDLARCGFAFLVESGSWSASVDEGENYELRRRDLGCYEVTFRMKRSNGANADPAMSLVADAAIDKILASASAP